MRDFQITEKDLQSLQQAEYPLNKETARILLDMTAHPGWSIFLRCLQFEANVYTNAALDTGYGPNAMEKFRFNQALAVNIPRIPRAIIESATLIIDEPTDLNSIYDLIHST